MNQKLSKLSLVFLFLLSMAAIGFAQSGRPAQTPAIEIQPSDTSVTKESKDVPVCEESTNEIEFIQMTERDDFFKRVNQYGACGYRLDRVVRVSPDSNKTLEQTPFTGLVKKDGTNKYEYSWFIADGPGRAQTLANNLAAEGFYLKKAFPFMVDACGDRADKIRTENDKDGILGQLANKMLGDNGIFFLFERKVGSPKKNEYRIIDADIPKTDFVDNQKKMQDLTLKGFRPVDLWYLGFLQYHFVIMEKDDEIKPEGEYIFDKELYGVSKDLTKYAEMGYEPLILGTGLSILKRTTSSPRNVKYYIYDRYNHKKFKKNFIPLLPYATLVETGLDYGVLLCDLGEYKWAFSVPLNYQQTTPSKETIILNIVDVYIEYKAKNSIPEKVELNKEQVKEIEKNMTERLNRLLKENYKIVNYNYFHGFTFLLERVK